MGTIYGLGTARVTLRDATGANLTRYTFQTVQPEGLKLIFTPEGKEHPLGSSSGYRKGWTSRGVRPSLDLSWAHGLSSWKEAWNGSAWGPMTELTTVEAVARMLQGAVVYPALVEPHTDHAFTFEAQPDLKAFEFSDIKGLLHQSLAAVLIGQVTISKPTWATSPARYTFPVPALTNRMLHSNKAARLTLYDAGGTPVRRWTLQMTDRAGRVSSWKPEGEAIIGAIPTRKRSLLLTGWRPSLKLKWTYDTAQAKVETWSGSAWGVAASATLAEALGDVVFYGDLHDILVEPFGASDTWADFQARPYAQKLSLTDLRGILHKGLELQLEGVTSQGQILT